jgi:hypothetical protein
MVDQINKYVGVPSTVNIILHEYIDGRYPLHIPFHIDEDTTAIQNVDLNYIVGDIQTSSVETYDGVSDINNTITIIIDGIERTAISEDHGTIDLTAWVTTIGWHEIELRSITIKRISAQLSIKSFVHM